MACPFGFGNADGGVDANANGFNFHSDANGFEFPDDEDDELQESELADELIAERLSRSQNTQPKKSSSKKAKASGVEEDPNDPLTWFRKNQVKTEKDFQTHKNVLQDLAKQKLEQLSKAYKRSDWPSDSEFDDWSIKSSELSDFNSDNDSLGSVSEYAHAWAQETDYLPKAEITIKCLCFLMLGVVTYCLFICFRAVSVLKEVHTVTLNSWWPIVACVMSGFMGVLIILMFFSAYYRSRKMLMTSLCGLTTIYASLVVSACLTRFKPMVVDIAVKTAACASPSKMQNGAKLCSLLPDVEAALSKCVSGLFWTDFLLGVSSLCLLVVGICYILELCYMEKKGFKHKRRHRRKTHNIPWSKIKISQIGAAAASQIVEEASNAFEDVGAVQEKEVLDNPATSEPAESKKEK